MGGLGNDILWPWNDVGVRTATYYVFCLIIILVTDKPVVYPETCMTITQTYTVGPNKSTVFPFYVSNNFAKC